ncbi:MAG: pre-peptidase C-terminal domain-containing protein, partial [Gemmataceae bacterium]|nr:pre-peptidase C-terminal domain-containing protein [Gemmataceae bacterium]
MPPLNPFRGRKAARGVTRFLPTKWRHLLAFELLEDRLVPSFTPEVEPNNLLAQSTALAPTESPNGFFTAIGTGALNPGTDVDYWSFTAQTGDRVSVGGFGGTNANSVRVELRSGSDAVLATATDNNGRALIGNFAITSPGTYYVRATTRDGGTNALTSYATRVNISRGFLAEVEPNDTLTPTSTTASPVTLAPNGSGQAVGRVSGAVAVSTEVDHFQLGNLRAGDTVNLSVSLPSLSTLDPRVELRNGNGAVLATATGTNALNFVLPANDLYYATVSANTAATAGTQGLYVLNVSVTDGSAPAVIGTTLPGTTAASGTALGFDGLIDHVAVADAPSLRPTNGVTVEAWVNFAADFNAGPSRVVAGKAVGTAGNNSYALWYQGSNLRGVVGNASAQSTQVTYSWVPTPGVWYHVAFAYESVTGTQRLFVNGAPVATNTAAVNLLGYDANQFLIGADINNQSVSAGFSGQIDEVRVWNAARTPTDVQANANVALAGTETGLAGYWRLNEGSGTTTADLTANANTGTLGGFQGSRPAWVTGGPVAGGALSFDGVNDFVQVNDSTSLRPTAGVTLEAWVNFASTTGGAIVAKNVGTATNNSFALWYASGALRG